MILIKRLIALAAVIGMLAGFTGCSQSADSSSEASTPPSSQTTVGTESGEQPAADDKLTIISTIFPGYDFARHVAGERAEVSILVPPGSESHSYEPSPQDIIRLQNCDMFIYVGGESDAWVDGMLESMDTSNMTIVAMMDLVDVVEEELKEGMEDTEDHDHDDAENHDDEEEEAEYDEHVWTSPRNAMAIVQSLSVSLSEIDPENADEYGDNAAEYVAQLEDLDAEFRDIVANATHKTLIFGDRFPFRYFTDEYGLDYYAAFPGCSTEVEPSAQTVAFLIDKINQENIPMVLYIEMSNERMADAICESTGASKMLLHSCHNITLDERNSGVTYLDLMQQNAQTLKEALA